MSRTDGNDQLVIVVWIVEVLVIEDERGALAGCRCDWFVMIALAIVVFRAQLGLLIVCLIRTLN